MSKIIVLHNRYTNEPVVIRVSAINAITKVSERTENGKIEECSDIMIGSVPYTVKETIGTVMTKIRQAESEDKE